VRVRVCSCEYACDCVCVCVSLSMLTVQKTNKNLLYFAETYLAKTCKNTLYFAENYPNGEFRMSYYEFYQICMNQSKLD